MSIEAPFFDRGDGNEKETVNVYDEKWYPKFTELYIEDYEYLTGDAKHRDEQKELFLNGEARNPDLGYPELETAHLEEKEKALLALKEEIIESEENEVVRQLYRWKLNEQIASVRMPQATKDGSDRRFARYSRFLYGEPDQEIFNDILHDLREELQEGKNSVDDSVKREATERLERSVSFDHASKKKKFDFPEFGIEDKKFKEIPITDSEKVKEIFEQAIVEYATPGWEAVIDESGNRTSLSASQSTRTAHIPNKDHLVNREPQLTEVSIHALAAHEIGTHARRRDRGERSKLHLLGLGLDRYLKGDEGVATYEEQKVQRAEDFSGRLGYLSISLAMGMDGKKRDFRDTFEVMRDYSMITMEREEGMDDEGFRKKAENIAWKNCVRIFRGTTGFTPGAVFSKDLVYREGNIGLWTLINENPEESKRFMIGKYDPTNSRHLWVLDQLGITDEDLEKLDQEARQEVEEPHD